MVFAAGLGTRMGALVAERPKPMIPVAGRPLLDHALALAEGLSPIVVNTHYRAEAIAAHLAPEVAAGRVILSHEPVLLETGGGLKAALPLLGPGPVLTLNADAVWTGPNPLAALAAAWAEGMGALLMLVPLARARGHRGGGDFALGPDGRIRRGGPYVYSGAQALLTGPVAAVPDAVFSLNRVWDGLIAEGRAFGIVHPGGWCDVGRPEGIAEAEAMLRDG